MLSAEATMPDQMMSDSNIVDVLQNLATVCRDGQEGYRTAAQETADSALKAMFEQMAQQREQEADELDQLIRERGGQVAARTGSLGGYAHRLFVSLRAALAGHNRAAALGEVARGESYAEAAFDRAKRLDLQGRSREVVQRLHDSVKASRDKVRRMAEAEGGWPLAAGQRSLETVGQYVSGNPVRSSVVALGVGFLIGAVAMMMARRGNGDAPARGRVASQGVYDATGRSYGNQDVAGG
jgi:uncharacterized protein (TIGR02284 family)